jgi:hypothetical protein
MTEDQYEIYLLKSSMELPYPLNYLRYNNPNLAVLIMMLKEKKLL